MPDMLLELFSEEIPARLQAKATAELQALVTGGLVDAGITYESAAAFVTPRRLCLAITGLLAKSPALVEERKGPRADAPDKAIDGFLRSTGLQKDQLTLRDTPKGQVYFATIKKPGRAAADVLAEVVPDVMAKFPWPKSMRWGSGSFRWVRPLQSILCILHDEAGTTVVPFEVSGIAAGDSTEGHRFMSPGRFTVTSFDDYRAKLLAANVRLDGADRADQIRADADTLAFAQGMEVVDDKGLLAEVAGLVEWPVVLLGDIAPAFLDLPPEVLQTSMREHQKFFSVKNPKTGRIEKFITVANRDTADNGATILAGNQKVLFARLSDARFFWENDLRVSLDDMAAKLQAVTFHRKLGTQAERVARIAALAREIAPMVGADADLAEAAAKICKADLSSEMVAEFPELQGLMGRYYASAAGHPDEVAAACEDHYAPLGPSDTVPSAPVSVAVALADKIDMLTGFWAIDEKPTSSKDPFALRRAAQGSFRLVQENDVRLCLLGFLNAALSEQPKRQMLEISVNEISAQLDEDEAKLADPSFIGSLISGTREQIQHNVLELKKVRLSAQKKLDEHLAWLDEAPEDLLNFFHDRLKVHLRGEGIRHDIIDACLAMPNNDDLTLLVNRAKALATFLKTDDGENLLQGIKRVNKFLSAEEKKDGVAYEGTPDIRFAREPAEIALFAALDIAEAAIIPAVQAEDFASAMAAMAQLRTPIDAFFTNVQVNADSQIVRRNRWCLLNRIREIAAKVADFNVISG